MKYLFTIFFCIVSLSDICGQQLKRLTRLANQGGKNSQYQLAAMYEHGEEVSQDLETAFDWYLKSAKQRHISAINQVGYMYDIGMGVEEDNVKASYWYKTSAEKGDAIGQFNLGIQYRIGEGLPQDYNKAFDWMSKSAMQGLVEAQLLLGVMYYIGEGTRVNFGEALYWYEESAYQGNVNAQLNAGAMYYKGEGIQKDLETAFRFFKESALSGNATAQYMLAYMFDNDEGYLTDTELRKAFQFQNKKSKVKSISGPAHDILWGPTTNKDMAFHWYQKSAEQMNPLAQYHLGTMYHKGIGTEINKEKGENWIKRAEANGLVMAKNEWNKLGLWKY